MEKLQKIKDQYQRLEITAEEALGLMFELMTELCGVSAVCICVKRTSWWAKAHDGEKCKDCGGVIKYVAV